MSPGHSQYPYQPARLIPLYGALFLFMTALFYPGSINADTVDMMLQGNLWPYHTWHSVFLAYVWHGLQKIHKGPGILFFLINLSFLGGLLTIVATTLRTYWWQCVATFVVALHPVTLVTLAAVGKDSATAALLMVAAAVLVRQYATESKQQYYAAAVAGLVIVAGCIRSDSLVAAVPLVAAAAWRAWPAGPRGMRMLRAGAMALGAIVASVLVTVGVTVGVNAERKYAVQVALGWDLTGIALRTGDAVYPAWLAKTAPPEDVLRHVYSEMDCIALYWGPEGRHLPITRSAAEVNEMFASWVAAALRHPVTMLKIRLTYATYLLGLRQTPDYLIFSWGTPGPEFLRDPDAYHARFTKSSFLATFEPLVHFASRTPLMQAWVYLLIAIGVLGAWVARPRRVAPWAAMLAASVILQIVVMIFLTASAQLRYLYWAVNASLAVAVVGACQYLETRRLSGQLPASSAAASPVPSKDARQPQPIAGRTRRTGA